MSLRVSPVIAATTTPGLSKDLGRAAAIGALEEAGFLPDDEDAVRAVTQKQPRPSLIQVLHRCGTPACRAAASLRRSRPDVVAGFVELGHHAQPLARMQGALDAWWVSQQRPWPMLRLLARADLGAALRAARPLVAAARSAQRVRLPLVEEAFDAVLDWMARPTESGARRVERATDRLDDRVADEAQQVLYGSGDVLDAVVTMLGGAGLVAVDDADDGFRVLDEEGCFAIAEAQNPRTTERRTRLTQEARLAFAGAVRILYPAPPELVPNRP